MDEGPERAGYTAADGSSSLFSLVPQDKISSITVDEVLASDPEIASAIDEDIKKGDFLP